MEEPNLGISVPPWLECDPSSGILLPGDQTTINISALVKAHHLEQMRDKVIGIANFHIFISQLGD